MPMHDWTRVEPNIFHDFHGRWLYAMADALNGGLLPPDYYALAEQRVTGALGIGPDILALDPARRTATRPSASGPVTAPATAFAASTRRQPRTPRLRRVAVRHAGGDEVVALIELVSPANKRGTKPFGKLLNKLDAALDQDIHLAVIDPFPPTPRHPDGVHAALWQRLRGRPPFQLPADRPLCASSYRVEEDRIRAYIQPFAVGGTVPPLPLYLTPDLYVTLPLEETYAAAFAGVPARWRDVLTA